MNTFRTFFNRVVVASNLRNFPFSNFNTQIVSKRTNQKPLALLQKPATSIKFSRSLQSILAKQQSHRELHDGSMVKKRTVRKKREQESPENSFNVMAFATSEEIDLEKLLVGLKQQDLYEPKKLIENMETSENEPEDVLCVTAKYQVGKEPRDLYFFRQGTVVLWNCTDLEEASNILTFLKSYEEDSYDEGVVHEECEFMYYNHVGPDQKSGLKNNNFAINKEDNLLEKYTFSNALSLSVKLGLWEAALDNYVDSMAYVTEDLKKGSKIKIDRHEMLRKTGELFALRHAINLSSDLLDTPDFYWDREHLETLFAQTTNFLSISRRTRVMNEKLNHCVELAELVSSNLNDTHHVRLEWMIIILIMVEVGFECLHYGERFFH